METRIASDRPVGGVFVGREREIAELRAALEDASRGRGSLYLLSGEPGIGKTRLADRFCGVAADLGAHVAWGRGWEGEGAPAFRPWMKLIGSVADSLTAEELATALGAGAAHVLQIALDLRERLPSIPSAPATPDSDEARFRLFDATARFLVKAAQPRPFVLVLDDLHWVDESSLLLLEFVARELRGARILLIGTYRDTEARWASAAADVLGALVREAKGIPLRGLSESEVATFMERIGGQPIDVSLAAEVHRATDGNPFFVDEVARLLAAEGTKSGGALPIPEGVRAALRRRLDGLPQESAEVLKVAAVLGRSFDARVLELASGQSGDSLLDLLSPAMQAGLIGKKVTDHDRYAFAHALISETIYDDLDGALRRRLHRAIGATLEDFHASDLDAHAAELAHHFASAGSRGDAGKALHYSARAARRAMSMLAYEEAAWHWERGLALLDSTGSADESARCEVLISLGQALWDSGSFERAAERYAEAAVLARSLGDAETLALATLGAGGPHAGFRPNSVDPRLIGLLKGALEALPEEDSPLRARLLARLGLALWLTPERERIPALAGEAIAMARRSGDARALVEVLARAHLATWGPDDLDERMLRVEEILKIADEIGDDRFAVAARYWRICHLLEVGDASSAARDLRLLQDRLREVRNPHPRAISTVLEGAFALLEGRFQEVERLASEAMAVGGPDHATVTEGATSQVLFVRREQGRLDEIIPALDAAMTLYPDHPTWRTAAAWIHAEAGHREAAARAIDLLAANDFRDLPRNSTWPFLVWSLAEAVILVEDIARANALYEQLLPFGTCCATLQWTWCSGSLERSLGNLAAVLGRFDAAERHFEAAARVNTRMQARPWLAWTLHDHARMLVRRGGRSDRASAHALATRALAVAEELGMTKLAGDARALSASAGDPRLTTDRQAAKPAFPVGDTQPPPHANVFRREGDYWTIAYDGTALRLRDAKGLGYLAELLRNHGREIPALDLVDGGREPARSAVPSGAGDLGDADEVLDAHARSEYRRRLRDLREELAEATRFNDRERAAKLSEEAELLSETLLRATGLGGRSRKVASAAERARVSVTMAIKSALKRIAESNPALGWHLAAAVRTGRFCSYEPDPGRRVDWLVGR